MYWALRFVSFLLKFIAVVNFLMTVFVYVLAYVAATTYSIPIVAILGRDFNPTPFITIFSVYWTLAWLIFACVGVYAAAQYIDAFLSIEKNVRSLAGRKLYTDVEEKPRRDLWAER